MSISGLRKASWYNPEHGTVVQANDIAEDGEFYTRAIEDPDDQTPTGESPYAGDESYCELMVFDMSLLPQLKAWQESDTHISMVAAGVQQNIQWYERDLVNVKPVYPVAAGRRNHINVVMERTGHGAHDIYGHVNLLAYLGTTSDAWTDEDNNGIADGYDVVGFKSKSFNNNKQSAVSNSSNTFNILRAFVALPIKGVGSFFRVDNLSIDDDDEQRVELLALDYNLNVLLKDTVRAQVGVKSLGINNPSNIYSLECRLANVESPTSENEVEVRYPALRVDGSDKYVSY